MSTITRMTLDELRNLPPLTDEEKQKLDAIVDTDDSDFPPLTPEEISHLRPWYEVHPEWVKMMKGDIHTKIDMDLLAALKKGGKGYQKRLNQTLRWALENGCPYIGSGK